MSSSRAGREKPWTRTLWVYDLRTNKHFTLKENPLRRADLDEFVASYKPGERHKRKPTWSEKTPDGRWRSYPYEEIVARDKASLDLFWLRDESLEDSANLPEPHVLAEEIAEDLRSALEQIEDVLGDLRKRAKRGLTNDQRPDCLTSGDLTARRNLAGASMLSGRGPSFSGF
jgi:type I restriction enzyme M protein